MFRLSVAHHLTRLQMPSSLHGLVMAAEDWQRSVQQNSDGTHTRKRSMKVLNKTPTHSQTDPCVSGIPQAQHKLAAEEAEEWSYKTFLQTALLFLTSARSNTVENWTLIFLKAA